MTRHILVLTTVVLITSNVFGQCAVSIITSSNPTWCLPCDGSASAAASGDPPFDISWSTGDSSTFSVDSLCDGIYIITIIDSSGCIAIDSITLTQASVMTVAITTTPATCSTCNDGSITITPSDGCGAPYTINTIPWDPFFMPSQAYPGTYVIEVCDNCGCCTQDTITVDSVWVGLIEKVKLKEEYLTTYPNPTTGYITLTNLSENGDTKITVYNVLGELVYEGQQIRQQIDLSYLPNGVYLLHFIKGKTTIRKKVIKL